GGPPARPRIPSGCASALWRTRWRRHVSPWRRHPLPSDEEHATAPRAAPIAPRAGAGAGGVAFAGTLRHGRLHRGRGARAPAGGGLRAGARPSPAPTPAGRAGVGVALAIRLRARRGVIACAAIALVAGGFRARAALERGEAAHERAVAVLTPPARCEGEGVIV